jgi:AcrR family transcriptional regulator
MISEHTSRGGRRRREILDAALACFLEKGVEATTLADIRARSGASTGSVYHLFASKEEIAGELFLGSLHDLHGSLLASLAGERDPGAAIRAVVEQYVAWVVREPDRARFLFGAPRSFATAAVTPELLAENRAFLASVKQRITAHARAGAIREMPMDIFVAVVLGPMQEWARQHLRGIAKTGPRAAARELGLAAWSAVRAQAG